MVKNKSLEALINLNTIKTKELQALIDTLNNTTVGSLNNQITALQNRCTLLENRCTTLENQKHTHSYEDDDGTNIINKTTGENDNV